MVRKASLERVTKETDIKVNINIDGENTGMTPIKAELIHKGIKIFTKL